MIKELINKYFLEKQKDRIQRHFYISDAGKCPRQVYYNFKNAPKKQLEPNFLRIFEVGNHFHQIITNSILNIKDIQVIASEVDIPPQGIVSGRADAIIKVDKELYVLDIKSINSKAFGYLKTAKEEHILQIQLYMHYFKIQKGILLYMDKDKLMLREFIVEYNPILVKKLLEDWDILKGQINSDTIPPRLAGYPSDWHCKYCKYKETCDLVMKNKCTNVQKKGRL